MNTKKIVIVAFMTLILVGLGILTLQNITRNTDIETPQETAQTTEATVGQLAELITRSENIQCTYTIDDPQTGKGEGLVYIDQSGRVRNDTTVTNEAGQASMHTLNDSVWVYTWTESPQLTFGTKIRLSEDTKMESLKETPIASGHILYKNVTYTCAPWVIDETMFIPPMEIKFEDLATTIENILGVSSIQIGRTEE